MMFAWVKANNPKLPPAFIEQGRLFRLPGMAPYFPANRDIVEYWYSTVEWEEDGCIFATGVVLRPSDVLQNKTPEQIQALIDAKIEQAKLSMRIHIQEHTQDRDAYHEKHKHRWSLDAEESTT